ncbi:hypothetical protein [Halobacterium jilantaiense]|uniref:Uncharacterized protein n=1 Tax=Halobacterium jilantaiense TaxID=355548 RepID=A0A1I0Q4R8_9EURY|nr:hypothetical protein [Halobacterium jilantaiense]SEW21977.1 hypothetical protein SAMN04487945_2278 [Halobacterium jilantaiense]
MVSVLDPAVLLTLAWVAVLFAAGFRYRWGSLPPVRALVVFSAALFWLAYSLTQLSAFFVAPYDDVLVAVAVGFLLGGAALFVQWWRRRSANESE